jgi:hypothetical protein
MITPYRYSDSAVFVYLAATIRDVVGGCITYPLMQGKPIVSDNWLSRALPSAAQ